uniref:Ig-like domain-containing protein n=1 Tax=Amphilophus citrinellus TaxID=61819 RepID=A0A3Q0QUC0_AMPCI
SRLVFLCFLYLKLLIINQTVIHTGLIDANDVTQTPILWKDQGNNATMSCSHTKGADYYQMYWYRQLPGQNMELIVFTTTAKKGDHDFGKFSKDKFSATKTEAQNGDFTVKNLDSSAVYFCAASYHSATCH